MITNAHKLKKNISFDTNKQKAMISCSRKSVTFSKDTVPTETKKRIQHKAKLAEEDKKRGSGFLDSTYIRSSKKY